MNNKDALKKELTMLIEEGKNLNTLINNEKHNQFVRDYQIWYTKAIKVVSTLASDRYKDFVDYYQIDPKRKSFHVHQAKGLGKER